jgi:hypothetical protein
MGRSPFTRGKTEVIVSLMHTGRGTPVIHEGYIITVNTGGCLILSAKASQVYDQGLTFHSNVRGCIQKFPD